MDLATAPCEEESDVELTLLVLGVRRERAGPLG